MTRKDYVALAEALKLAKPPSHGVYGRGERYGWQVCIFAVADALAKGNPRFDRQRFVAACEGEKS